MPVAAPIMMLFSPRHSMGAIIGLQRLPADGRVTAMLAVSVDICNRGVGPRAF